MLLLVHAGVAGSRGAVRFDVFPGYDGIVPEAGWFPMVFELKNDGPGFTATVEVGQGAISRERARRVVVELPTGTTKRVVVPVFCANRNDEWNARLVDERGKVQASVSMGLNAGMAGIRRTVRPGTVVLGMLTRTVSAVPPAPVSPDRDQMMGIARLQRGLFSDNPLTLDGLTALYLNAGTALDLKVPQVNALITWLQEGGHLIVSVEEAGDLAGVPWLQDLLPMTIAGTRKLSAGGILRGWVEQGMYGAAMSGSEDSKGRKRVEDEGGVAGNVSGAEFDRAEMGVVSGALRPGAREVIGVGGVPLVVEKRKGRGRVTLLTFSPELEPFLGWRNRPWFWSRLAGVSPEIYQKNRDRMARDSGWALDGAMGALIDTRQVQKLPLSWLLVLLAGYLLVIGPLDMIWLKRINRPMLTWITFPCYVVLFSGLIYFIGRHLRAGASEFNELHVVDVMPNGAQSVMRGRTFSSLYSPSNARYPLGSELAYATLRGEFFSNWRGGREDGSQAMVTQRGNGFEAQAFVPVWTSQLYVADWFQAAATPFEVVVTRRESNFQVQVKNNTAHLVPDARIVMDGQVFMMGSVPARQTRQILLARTQGIPLAKYVDGQADGIFAMIDARRNAFAGRRPPAAGNIGDAVMASGFMGDWHRQGDSRHLLAPAGFDLSTLAARSAIFLAWDSEHGPIVPLNKFQPARSARQTLYRMAVELPEKP